MAAQDDEGECEPLVLASRDSDAVALSRMEDSPSSPDDGGGNPILGRRLGFGARAMGGDRGKRYAGYATLGRVSLHDSWDDVATGSSSSGFGVADWLGHERDRSGASAESSDLLGGEDEDEGGFVSFWGDVGSDEMSSSSSEGVEDRKEDGRDSSDGAYVGRYANGEDMTDDPTTRSSDDDLVETTLTPMPLIYRNNHRGGMMGPPDDPRGGWFRRRERGRDHGVDRRSNRDMRRPWWHIGRWPPPIEHDDEDESDRDEDGSDHEDSNSLLEPMHSLLERSEGSDDDDYLPVLSTAPRSLWESPPRSIDQRRMSRKRNHERNNILLKLPIVRPFLRGRQNGFSDNNAEQGMLNRLDDAVNDSVDDEDGDGPSSRDRDELERTITEGIAGKQDESLLLVDPSPASTASQRPTDSTDVAGRRQQPNLFQRIFVTRFLQPSGGDGDSAADERLISQLHGHIRAEDWTLATSLLESNPRLASTWSRVDRLYGGRHDGEVMPIHAACALRPPSDFVGGLCDLMRPGGLLEKERSFERTPLHVACRSLAGSGVVRVLCEKEPGGVVERDSLRRVPLHYVIKNYTSFGGDDDDSVLLEDDGDSGGDDTDSNDSQDGWKALCVLIGTDPSCVKMDDHRSWLPLHVACSCSSRKGMVRVLRLLLDAHPEGVLAKTSRGSDVFDCVDMAGAVHPTRDNVVALLREAKAEVETGVECAEAAQDRDEGDPEAEGSATHESDSSEDARTSGSLEDEPDQFEETPTLTDCKVGNLLDLDGDENCDPSVNTTNQRGEEESLLLDLGTDFC